MKPGATLIIADPAALGALSPGSRDRLEAVLTRADAVPLETRGVSRTLFHLFGFDPAVELPSAAVTRQADLGDAGTSHWMRADPAWMDVGSRLVLKACGDLGLSGGEVGDLEASLREHFDAAGLAFSAPGPGRWYLRLPVDSRVDTTPPDELGGRDCADHLPGGAEADAWRRLLGETQMILHNHPVNEARRGAGRAPVNSLWFHGWGRLPARADAGFARVIGADALARGLASLPGGSEPGAGALLVVDGGGRDAAAWEAWEASGESGDVLVPGAGWRFRVRRGQRLRFWRAPRPLERLLAAREDGRR